MRKILVPVDGSAPAEHALRHAIEAARRDGATTIVLLNVQHALERWYKHGLMNEEALRHLREQGEDESAAARALLDEAGVIYDFDIVFGAPAEVIVRLAGERGCAEIVMGTRGLGDVENAFLGSVAHRVIQLAEIPVTLVK
jgi:nucleotide-binding universal stress UspA family protein